MDITAKRPRAPRRSLTKQQLQTELGIELLSLCQTATTDGRLTESELDGLRQWLKQNAAAPLPAIAYLNTVIGRVIEDGQITHDEYRDIHLAIEAVLPSEIRLSARARRQTAELADYEAARSTKLADQQPDSTAKSAGQPYPVIEDADFMVAGVRHEGRAMVISKFVRDGNAIALVRDRITDSAQMPSRFESRRGI